MPEAKEIYVLPEELVLPLVASWRTMEKSCNPVFSFIFKCSACSKYSAADGSQGPQFVTSKKKIRESNVIIGIQCQTEGCGMTIKFEKPISAGNDDFPQRLKKYPSSALVKPDGQKKISEGYVKTITKLLDL